MTDYERYQLQWMIDHDHPLTELFDEIIDYAMTELDTDAHSPFYPDLASAAVEESIDFVINKNGFNDEMFVCEQEYNNFKQGEQ